MLNVCNTAVQQAIASGVVMASEMEGHPGVRAAVFFEGEKLELNV